MLAEPTDVRGRLNVGRQVSFPLGAFSISDCQVNDSPIFLDLHVKKKGTFLHSDKENERTVHINPMASRCPREAERMVKYHEIIRTLQNFAKRR